MAEPAPRGMTVEQFFAWQEGQAERYELVNGQPLEMMAGAKNVHDDIVVNLVTELGTRLRGGPCRPFTEDGSVETRPGQIRRPTSASIAARAIRTEPRRRFPSWSSKFYRRVPATSTLSESSTSTRRS